MRSTRRRIRSLLTATAILGTTLIGAPATATTPACTGAATEGCWRAPFSETGKYDTAPPATPQEAGEFATAVSMAVMPDGRIVYWDGLSGLNESNVALPLDAGRTGQTPDRSRVLDLGTVEDPSEEGKLNPAYADAPFWSTPVNETGGSTENLFCSDQRLLANGTLVVAGGTKYETSTPDFPDEVLDPEQGMPDGLAELYGSKHTREFRIDEPPVAGGWTWPGTDTASGGRTSDMGQRRWYPSLVTLPNSSLLVMGGVSKLLWNSQAHDERATALVPLNVPQTEIYNPTTKTWTDNGASGEVSLPLYPRVHLLPNGEVFYTGAGQMWGPAGEAVDELSWMTRKAFDPTTKTWRDLDIGPIGARNGAFSVMLPLKPPYDRAQILVAGGTLGVSPGLYLGTTFTELITVADDAGTWTSSSTLVRDLNNRRWFSSGVLLPNGQVLALSGADNDEVVAPGSEQAVRVPELYDPATDTWTQLAAGSRDRTYHNSAMLLPDGSVLVGGHSPLNFAYGGEGNNGLHDLGLTGNGFRDPSFEILYPPYLYDEAGAPAQRPIVQTAPNNASHGGTMTATLDPTSIDVATVVLMRLPSVTHTTDADMRAVEVGFSQQGTALTIDVPSSTSVLPPGQYYLWALSADGVPSIAKTIRID